MKHFSQKQSGFTLIELLVVIAIIGLLASIILASLNTARAKGRDARRLADLHSIETALALYASDNNGKYPVSVSSSYSSNCSSYGGYPTSGPTGYIPNLAPQYMPILPLDPNPISTYGCYLYISNGTDYAVFAHATVETYTPANNPRPRPAVPTQASFDFYTPGGAVW